MSENEVLDYAVTTITGPGITINYTDLAPAIVALNQERPIRVRVHPYSVRDQTLCTLHSANPDVPLTEENVYSLNTSGIRNVFSQAWSMTGPRRPYELAVASTATTPLESPPKDYWRNMMGAPAVPEL